MSLLVNLSSDARPRPVDLQLSPLETSFMRRHRSRWPCILMRHSTVSVVPLSLRAAPERNCTCSFRFILPSLLHGSSLRANLPAMRWIATARYDWKEVSRSIG